MPKISIIIPVYQVEKYLERCLKSVIEQTFCNYECILVDDGSPDHSGEICDWYAEKEPRFTVIHKENGGLSSARNAALEVAVGEYICFLDSDDLLHPQALEIMLGMIITNDADMTAAKLREFSDEVPCMDSYSEVKSDILTQEDFIDNLLPENFGKISVTACGKLYKKEVFRSIRFPEGEIYEDLRIFLDVLLSCKIIAVLNTPLYYYYKNPASITRSSYLAHDRFGEFVVREKYIDFYCKLDQTEQMQYALNDYLTFFMRNYFAVTLCYPQKKQALKPHIVIFRTHLQEILINVHICRMRKICTVGMLCFPRLTYKLARRCIPDCLIEEMR